MKKFLSSLIALLMMGVATTASAQAAFAESTNGDFRIGLQLGFNMPSFAENQYGMTLGYNIGATALLNTENFIPDSYLRGSVLYSRKGASAGTENIYKGDKVDLTLKDATYYLHYTEVPIRFGYAYEMDSELSLLVETGPYFGLRWTSSLRADEYSNAAKPDQKTFNGDMKDLYKDLRRFDWGWGIHAGVLIAGKYQIMAGYDWGLSDVVPDITGGNRNLSINLAVYFD